MQIGETVNVVKAFPGVSSLCAFGCASGRIGIFDGETNRLTYNYIYDKPIVAIDVDDENVVYTADSFNVFRHDKRIAKNPTIQFRSQNIITDIAVFETSIAAATKDGIIVSDGRNIQKKISETKVSNVHPVKLHFLNKKSLASAYADSSVILWDFYTEEMTQFEVPLMLKNRKMMPLDITSWTQKSHTTIAVGYESGVTLYEDQKLLDHLSFNQRGKFNAFTAGPCFGNDYLIAVVDNCSILPCSQQNGTANPITLHGVNISSITANYLMLVAADDDEEGYIAVLMPEAFGSEFF